MESLLRSPFCKYVITRGTNRKFTDVVGYIKHVLGDSSPMKTRGNSMKGNKHYISFINNQSQMKVLRYRLKKYNGYAQKLKNGNLLIKPVQMIIYQKNSKSIYQMPYDSNKNTLSLLYIYRHCRHI